MKASFWHVYKGVDASLKTPHRAGSDPYREKPKIERVDHSGFPENVISEPYMPTEPEPAK